MKKELEVVSIPLNKIVEETNLRDPGWEKKVSELEGLIDNQGLLQPIGVYPEDEKFKLIFGSRRLAACKNLGWKAIPAQVFKKMSASDEFLSKFGENSGREDLSPMEEAKAFRRAIDEKLATPKDLAKFLKKTPGYISQRLQLLKLPEEVQKAVEEARISFAHAREISRVDDEKKQVKLLTKAERMSTPELKDYIDSFDDTNKTETRGRKPKAAKVPSKLFHPREEDEIIGTLGQLDDRLRNAKEKALKLQMEYYKGLIRGITWALRMGGSDELTLGEGDEAQTLAASPESQTKSRRNEASPQPAS